MFTALTLMLYLLVPWTAANLVDFFFVRRGHYAIADLFDPRGRYGAWGARGLIAYGLAFRDRDPVHGAARLGGWTYTGPLAKRSTASTSRGSSGWPSRAASYWGLCRSLDVRRELA